MSQLFLILLMIDLEEKVREGLDEFANGFNDDLSEKENETDDEKSERLAKLAKREEVLIFL